MEYIKESIIDYIKKENTNYAILLNGNWGSGKTYFWEHNLKPAIENTEIHEKKQKTIYVSLYGVSKLEEINKKIVLNKLITNSKIQKIAKNKWGGRLTELAKMGIGLVESLEIPYVKNVLGTKINFENLLDFTNTILCFDDLERANIDISTILGYINNFVEHDGTKVIIIGYEEEIAEKMTHKNLELKMLVSTLSVDKVDVISQKNNKEKEQKPLNQQITDNMNSLFYRSNEYKRIKEKLIGKTLTLQPNYSDLISNIVNQGTNFDFKTFLNKNIENIIHIFKESQTNNVRILKQALDDFELIFSKYNKDCSDLGDGILTSILRYTLASSFEIKNDQKGNAELAQATKDTFLVTSFSRQVKNDSKVSYIEKFVDKYSLRLINEGSFVFFPFVIKLVREGIFDLEQFNSEMKSIREKIEQKKNAPLYLRLINEGYYYLTDEEFTQASSEAYEKIVDGKIPFVRYLEAFNLYRYFIEEGLIPQNLQEIKKDFLEGLDKAAETSEYYPNLNTYFINITDEADKDLIIFKEKIHSINEKLKVKSEEKNIEKLLNYMGTDFKKFTHEMMEHYWYKPIFENYSVDDLFEKIISLSNEKINTFTILLEKRYSNREDNVRYKLYLDKQLLLRLASKIKKYNQQNKTSLKVSLLKKLVHILENVDNNLGEIEPKDTNSN